MTITDPLAHRLGANLARLDPPGRHPGIDLARGLAVLGMFAAHLIALPVLEWSRPDTWSGLAAGRSSILFATVAGVSITLSRRSDSPQSDRLLAARALIIWLIGMALVLLGLPVHVILPAYGVLFVIAIGLVRLSDRGLWVVAAVCATAGPPIAALVNRAWPPGAGRPEAVDTAAEMIGWHYPFVVWAAFLAVGVIVGRRLADGSLRAVRLVVLGAVLALVGYGPIEAAAEHWSLPVLSSDPHSSGIGEVVGSGGFVLAVIGLCSLVTRTRLRGLLLPLRAVGSMPLTAYTAHLVVWAVWVAVWPVDGLDGFRELHMFWPITVGVVVGCTVWAMLLGSGPVERLVSRLARSIARPIVPAAGA
ncbi:heparan-alpha-glucosaminide N-acetyltransferase domain-containing protein [Gordonia caeni]|uniref:Heparan-alpha-glucosaminide N-acetyltransferase catalytic domain-containing protein n=1 Tax=Gordonia caeni TaxID=1007097 RepID=A0ABP7P083_9ACTN